MSKQAHDDGYEVQTIPGQAVIEYGITEAVLAELRGFWKDVTAVTDDNYDAVKSGCKVLVTLRTGIETKRNELLADARSFTDNVNTEAKRVTGLVAAIEGPAKALKDGYDAKQRAAKEKAEAKEKKRTEAINAAIDQIDALGTDLDGMTADMLAARLAEVKGMTIDLAVYAEFHAVALERHESAVAKVEAARYRRIEFEQEQLRLKEEAEKLDAQRVADEAKRVAEQAEIDRQKEELAEGQRQFAAQQDTRAKELAEAAAVEQAGKDAEAQAARDAEIAEQAAADERKRLSDEQQATELAEAEARELAPDKDKLLSYAREIAELSAAAPTLQHAKAQKMLERSTEALDGIANALMDWAGKV